MVKGVTVTSSIITISGSTAEAVAATMAQEQISLSLSGIKIFRDIYYLPLHGIHRYEVPEDHFFAMGDNSVVSGDSREYTFGSIPMKQIQGRPILRSIHWDFSRFFSPRKDWEIDFVR